MKKFEITVKNSEYDYVTKKILSEELKSVFPKMIFEVKTVPQKNKKAETKHENKTAAPACMRADMVR